MTDARVLDARPVDADLLGALDRLAIEVVGITTIVLAEVAGTFELTLAQWRILVIVGERGGVRIGEVATRIGSSLPSASRMIGRLERRGLVTTDRDPADRRARLVRLTDQGALTRRGVLRRRRRRIAAALRRHPRLPSGLRDGLRAIVVALGEYA